MEIETKGENIINDYNAKIKKVTVLVGYSKIFQHLDSKGS